MICAPDGGILDDLIVYRLAEAEYLVVANAANTATVAAALHDRAAGHDAQVARPDRRVRADLPSRGRMPPGSWPPLADIDLDGVKYYSGYRFSVAGQPVLLARTGYTGRGRFRAVHRVRRRGVLWRALAAAGAGDGLVPAGLAARDTLRLEAGMPLYGN